MKKNLLKLVLSLVAFQTYANTPYILGTNQAPLDEPQANKLIESQVFFQKNDMNKSSNAFYEAYIRCYYLDKNSKKANINYLWGKTRENQYAIVKGSWYEKTRLWNNIYYTEASDIDLKQTCINALQFAGFAEKDFNNVFVNYSAAMWKQSYDADFWSDIKNTPPNKFSRMVVLGDSAFDTHNIFDKGYWELPNQEGYFHGRFSNGPVMVEYLAKLMNLSMKVIAEGGAEIKGTGSQGFLAKSLGEQFQLYKGFIDNLPVKYTNDIGSTFFIVFIGSNDLKQQTDADPQNSVPNLIKLYLIVIDGLVNKGANHIMIPVFPDITLFPDIAAKIKENPPLQKIIDQQIISFNRGIQQGLIKFNDKTKYPNLHIYRPNFDEMLNLAKVSGAFKNLKNKCSSAGYATNPTVNTVCNSPLDYFMWDGMHPSTKAHCMWANAIVNFLSIQLGVQIDRTASCEYNYVHIK